MKPSPGGEITIETPAHLFKAEFVRDGSDLVLKNNGVDDIRIVDYFAQSNPADLVASNGARLTGETVEKLAGPMAPGQYAQAGQGVGGEPIGQVETVQGGAQVQRADGTVQDLVEGMKVFQNDVVSTADGGKLSVTFLDGTIFTLAANSRMVLDELVYSPEGDDNSATFSLIEGGFVFVAGQVAKTGEMEVSTPSATMGIRGTTVSAFIGTVDGVLALTVTLLEDFDGSGTGVVQLFDLSGNLITTITATDSKWVVPLEGQEPYEVARTDADDASDQEIISDAADAFAQAYTRVGNGQNFVEQNSTSSTPSPTVNDEPSTLDGNDTNDGGSTTEGEGGSDGGGGDTSGSGQNIAPVVTPDDPTELDTNTAPETNNAPEAPNTQVETDEDNSVSGSLPATDADGDTLTYTLETPPENGVVVLFENGEFVYSPNENFNGPDGFTYQVNDGNGGVTTAEVTLNVDAVNDAPITTAVEVTATEDNVFQGSVASSASDTEGESLTFSLFQVGGPTPQAAPALGGSVSPRAAEPGPNDGIGPLNGVVVMQPDGSFTYTPNPNFSGEDFFTYQVTDAGGATSFETVNITVEGVNDAPVATDLNAATSEDTDLESSVAEQASDADGDNLTFSIVAGEGSGPQNGSVNMAADGSFTYTPDTDFNGTDSFTYQVDDGNGGVTTATVNITIDAENDAPIADDVSVSTDEDEALDGSVAEAASDVEGDALTFALVEGEEFGPQNGAVDMASDGSFTYTPDADFNGTDSFTYQVDDGNGGTTTATVTVTVDPVNDDPIASDVDVSVAEDDAIEGSLIEDAFDVDGDNLTFSLVSGEEDGPFNGDVVVNEDGTYTYTPDPDFNGEDSFTYQVSDGNGGITTATVTVTVDPANDDPEAGDVDVSVDEDNTLDGTLAEEAFDLDGDDLTFSLVVGDGEEFISGPFNGEVTINDDGTYSYTPDADFNGEDSFTYQVDDGNGGFATGTVTVTVNAVNDDPVVDEENSDLDVSGDEDTEITGMIVASDVDGDDLTFDLAESEGGGTGDDLVRGGSFMTSEPTNGELTLNADGSFTFVPDADFNGSDSFDFEVSDGNGGTATGTVNITVEPVNDDPIAGDISGTTDEDTDLEGSVASAAFDVDGDDLTFAVVQSGEEEGDSGPSNGSVVMDEDGSFTYTPNADFNGTDSFAYVVSDGNGGSATATVNITVEAVNDVPQANDLTFNGVEDDKLDGQVTATDPDGDDLTFAVLTQPESGSVEMNEDGTFTFFPEADFNGEVTFTYQVSDNGMFLDQEFDDAVPQFGTVTINLEPENDAPEADDQFFEVQADGEFTGQLIATDIDGDTLEFDPLTQPEQGELTLNTDGSFTFVPDEGASGFDTFQVQVLDEDLEVDVFEVTFAYGDDGGSDAEELGLDVEFNLTATEDAPAGSATITRSEVTATPINIVFALDFSGSFFQEFDQQVDAVRATVNALQEQFEGSNTPVTIQFTLFSGGAKTFGPFDLFDEGGNGNGLGIDGTLEQIEGMVPSGSTSWVAALNAANGFYTDQQAELGDGVNILYLITDGQPTDSDDQIAGALFNLRSVHDVDILTFGIGETFDEGPLIQDYEIIPEGADDPVTLVLDSDGTAPVITVDDLSGALQETPIFAAELTSFELSLQSDGEDQGVIADETSDAFEEQDLNFLLSLAEVDGIEDVLGETNDFQAVAVFDTDGDLTTTEDQVNVVSSARIERPDEAVTESGLDGADLLVGGEFDDVLTGNDGNDMLIAGGGLDELRGGLGDDILVIDEVPASGTIVDGGSGEDDELNFTIGGDLTGILPTLTITEIEAIEMENGLANTLTLTSGDIAGLSDTASSEVEDIFSDFTFDTTDTVIVFGDDQDTLNLTADPGGIIIESGTETRGDDTFTLYTFQNGVGDVTAVLAVDDDVTVTGVTPTF
ncbi:MAG: Ig-like domain-containing protein [Pseudomonadota bacterium]